MKDMQGTVRLRAVVVDDQQAVMVDLPNGASFALGRVEMLGFCFSALRMVRGMYASPEELNAAVALAHERVTAVPQGPPQ
jgi:hypothetical protein